MINGSLGERLSVIDEAIADAARRASREPKEISRIVVTKFHPADTVRELYELGVRDVGENRQQEFSAKATDCETLSDLRWHFIGQAQTNKAGAIRRAAHAVHSVDRTRIADALDRAAFDDSRLDIFIQINLTDDPGRGGVDPGGLEAFAEHVLALPTLTLRGLMAVAPLGEEPSAAFERLHGYAQRLRGVAPEASWISAGMTGDFAEAIAAGATHLRIGSAITGPRPVQG